MARVMLRQCTIATNLTKLLRQSQIRMVKFSSDSDDTEDAKQKLSSLLSSIKSNERKVIQKDPRQAKPRPGSVSKKDRGFSENVDASGVPEELQEAVKNVSKLAKSSKRKAQTESALLKKLKSISADANNSKSTNEVSGEKSSTADFFSDFKVEKKPVSKVMTDRKAKQEQQKNLTLEQIAFLEKRARMRRQKTGASLEENYVPIDLFGGSPIGVFTKPVEPAPADPNTLVTWRNCVHRELTLLSQPPPRNAIEEHILWTEKGKLWHFPVDNEQGLDYSHEPFHKHVFLEHLLEPWCPPAGPVRHFMELVCLALSKNPYVSVDYKMKTVTWFKDFFEQPEINEILVHQGAWEEKQAQTS